MKKRNLVFALALAVSFAACNNNTEENTSANEVIDTPATAAGTPAPETQPTPGQQLDTALANTKEAAADGKQEVKDAASATKEGIKDAAKNVKEGTKEVANDVKEGTKAAAQDVKHAAKEGAKKVEKAAKDVKEDLEK